MGSVIDLVVGKVGEGWHAIERREETTTLGSAGICWRRRKEEVMIFDELTGILQLLSTRSLGRTGNDSRQIA